ncbi:MAG: acylneuraminate cytidylyltransferase family protein [Bdellovibrionota bacterium]|nr:acylneuraminate cytidylyltransferase family protein [Bdellovibrionota bacterium]
MNGQSIGIIPARAGSKRIPNKNIKSLMGKPLIQYTIEQSLQAKELDRVFISTDSEEIAEIGKSLGAEVPYLRPRELAGDKSNDYDVLSHFLDWFKNEENNEVDSLVYLRPTTPFKKNEHINQAVAKFRKGNYTGLRSVTRVEGVHHPYWMYKSDESELLSSIVPGVTLEKYFQSQLLPECFRLNGVVDIISPKMMTKESLYGKKVGYFEIENKFSLDIDTMEDFEYCEYLMNKQGI